MSEKYDADYFLRGKATGKSLYEDYRWMPEMTKPMVCAIVSHLGIRPEDTILDFGCARGYIVRAFCELGYSAYGVDCSEWALNHCDESVRHRLFRGTNAEYDWVIAKDVLEHVGYGEETAEARSMAVVTEVQILKYKAIKGVFAVVPLSNYMTSPYVVPEYELDITHVHRWDMGMWMRVFTDPGWSVEGRYRVPGIKDNYAQYKTGNGFIVARRIEE
jgi:Methyltransferase domain